MGTIQWQHGTFMQNANGSLSLSPIAVDGRQQTSNPCSYTQSVYTRYNQPELFAVRCPPVASQTLTDRRML